MLVHPADRRVDRHVGSGGYSASQGVDVQAIGGDAGLYAGDIWHYARNQIIVAARAAGLAMIDGPYAGIANPEGYRRACTRAKILGASGKWAIHSSQIDIANDVFSPTPD